MLARDNGSAALRALYAAAAAWRRTNIISRISTSGAAVGVIFSGMPRSWRTALYGRISIARIARTHRHRAVPWHRRNKRLMAAPGWNTACSKQPPAAPSIKLALARIGHVMWRSWRWRWRQHLGDVPWRTGAGGARAASYLIVTRYRARVRSRAWRSAARQRPLMLAQARTWPLPLDDM